MKLVSALGAVCFFALSLSPATARQHHHTHMDSDGRYTQSDRYWREHVPYRSYSKRRVAHTKHRTHHARHAGVSTGRVCSANDRCARVVAWAASAFQGAIREFEALGYAIGSPGCLSRGHMRNSKHHWGGACDLFNQTARDKTALRQPPPDVQIAVAERNGLLSGCAWRDRDCGHIETRGRTASRMKAYAAAP